MRAQLKTLLGGGIIASAMALVATQAYAIPINDLYDPEPNITIDTSNSHGYNHTIAGFNSLTDTVTSALLAVVLSDSGGSEGIQYNLEGNIYNQNNTGNAAQTYNFDFGALGILAVLSDGVLNVTLSATSGAYILNSSTLSGEFVRQATTEPEDPVNTPAPGMAAILGLGLAGLGYARRRK